MGKIGLKIKADLKNVDKFYPGRAELFCWALKVKCTACRELNPNWHFISEDDSIDVRKAKVNFLYECKCCRSQNSLTVIPSNHVNSKTKHQKNNLDTVYTQEDDGQFKMLVSFDCRGLELVEYEPGDGWTVISGEQCFDNVDLQPREWFDYNEKNDVPVEITNLEYEFEHL